LDEISSNKCKYNNIRDAIEEKDQQKSHEAERGEFEKIYYEIQDKLFPLLDNMTVVSHSSTHIGV